MATRVNMSMALNRYAFAAGVAVQLGQLRNQINKIAAQETVAKASVKRPPANVAAKAGKQMNGRTPVFAQKPAKPETKLGEALKAAIRNGSSRVSKRSVAFHVK